MGKHLLYVDTGRTRVWKTRNRSAVIGFRDGTPITPTTDAQAELVARHVAMPCVNGFDVLRAPLSQKTMELVAAAAKRRADKFRAAQTALVELHLEERRNERGSRYHDSVGRAGSSRDIERLLRKARH